MENELNRLKQLIEAIGNSEVEPSGNQNLKDLLLKAHHQITRIEVLNDLNERQRVLELEAEEEQLPEPEQEPKQPEANSFAPSDEQQAEDAGQQETEQTSLEPQSPKEEFTGEAKTDPTELNPHPPAEPPITESAVQNGLREMGIEGSGVELNDRNKGNDNSLANRLGQSKIDDLKKAIGLNERFLFSNELFNGNMEAFNRSLNELNHIATREDAHKYINLQLKEQYNWDEESETVAAFLSLVERRFIEQK